MFVFKGQQQQHKFPAAPPRDPIFQPCIKEHHRLLQSPPFAPREPPAWVIAEQQNEAPPDLSILLRSKTRLFILPPLPTTTTTHLSTTSFILPDSGDVCACHFFCHFGDCRFPRCNRVWAFLKKKKPLGRRSYEGSQSDKGMRWSGGTQRALRVSGQTGRVHQGGLIAAAHLDLKSTGREDTDSFQHLSCYSEAAIQSSIAQDSKPSKPLPSVKSKLG